MNDKYKSLLEELRNHAEEIAVLNPYRAIKCMKGMAFEKYNALCHPYPAKIDIINKYGYDGKQLHHLLRIEHFLDMYNYMITKILNICKWVISKLSLKDWVIIILLILCGCFYFSYRHYYHESLTPVVVYNTDSLEIYKDKLKNEYVAKEIYVQDVTNLLREKG